MHPEEINILREGELVNKILQDRFFNANKNILMAYVGPTGGGKSWGCLKTCENWYKYKLKKPFPKDNICFNPEEVMNRIVNGNLERGSLLIMEEAGINMSSLEFQSKIAKLFNYVLQSFRSMNVGLLINLPYLSMLNKTTRMLLHYILKTQEIKKDYCYFRIHKIQINQETGKIYRHSPRFNYNGVVEKVDMIKIGKPSDDLIKFYEQRKADYVSGVGKDVLGNLKSMSYDPYRKKLTARQQQILDLRKEGLKNIQIAQKLQVNTSSITNAIEYIRKKGDFGI